MFRAKLSLCRNFYFPLILHSFETEFSIAEFSRLDRHSLQGSDGFFMPKLLNSSFQFRNLPKTNPPALSLHQEKKELKTDFEIQPFYDGFDS